MPTVPFLIVAAWCFSRSSPKIRDWLYNQKFFGPMLSDWDKHGAIRPKAKALAIIGMMCGFSVFYYFFQPSVYLWISVASVFIVCGILILSRPNH